MIAKTSNPTPLWVPVPKKLAAEWRDAAEEFEETLQFSEAVTQLANAAARRLEKCADAADGACVASRPHQLDEPTR
jgi:hypothetical protein